MFPHYWMVLKFLNILNPPVNLYIIVHDENFKNINGKIALSKYLQNVSDPKADLYNV